MKKTVNWKGLTWTKPDDNGGAAYIPNEIFDLIRNEMAEIKEKLIKEYLKENGLTVDQIWVRDWHDGYDYKVEIGHL